MIRLTITVERDRVICHIEVGRVRSKALAKRNEEEDVARLVERLCGPPDALHAAFHETWPDHHIRSARIPPRAGGRSEHYDFEIEVEGPSGIQWWKVEHKGSATAATGKKTTKKAKDNPMCHAVQFYNGGMEKFRLCQRYAQLWYEVYVGSEWLRTAFEIEEKTPTVEEWIADARSQGAPRSAFGKALKRALRASGASLLPLRDQFVPWFVDHLEEVDREALRADVFPLLCHALDQKDAWLTVTGDVLSGAFDAKWHRGIRVQRCDQVTIRAERDVVGEIHTDVGVMRYILRWGGGAGLSNLRLDFK
jgi:hypothetical protein